MSDSIHDQVRRTVMAHCFKRLRDMPEESIDLTLSFLRYAKADKEAKAAAKAAASGRRSTGGPLSPASTRGSGLLVKEEEEDAAVEDDKYGYQSNGDNSSSQPIIKDARSVKVSAIGAELRRMGDAVYGLQISSLHLTDLCVLGHILNIRRSTDYIEDCIAEFAESEKTKQVLMMMSPVRADKEMGDSNSNVTVFSGLNADTDSSVPTAQVIQMNATGGDSSSAAASAATARSSGLLENGAASPSSSEVIVISSPASAVVVSGSTAKKRKRVLSKSIMVTELEDYHRTSQPQQKRERRSALTTLFEVPCVLPPKKASAPKGATTAASSNKSAPPTLAVGAEPQVSKAEEKRLAKEAKDAAKAQKKADKVAEKEAKKQAKAEAKKEKVSKVTPAAGEGLSAVAVAFGGPEVLPPVEKKSRKDAAPPAAVVSKPPPPQGPSLLASLGIAGFAPQQPVSLAMGHFDFDGPSCSSSDFEEEETHVAPPAAVVESSSEESDSSDDASTESDDGEGEEQLAVVSGNVFVTTMPGGSVSHPAVKAAAYDFTADIRQRDASDFLLKQVALQGTLSTRKGAELLVSKGVPFVPVGGPDGAEDNTAAAPQGSKEVAEKFVISVFKLFHKQEKIAFDHGVAYIY